ncbi:ribosomal protein L1, partial [Aureobasidium sp. EXF-8845]
GAAQSANAQKYKRKELPTSQRKKKSRTTFINHDLKDAIQFPLVDAMRYLRATEVGRVPTSSKYELHLRLKSLKNGPVVRNRIRLPHPVKTDLRIAVICDPNSSIAAAARKAGATLVGEEAIFDAVKEGRIEFDRCLCHQDSLAKMNKAALGRILGPRGLMPSAKTGTVVKDVSASVQDMVGASEYRERLGVIRMAIGQLGMTPEELSRNIRSFIENVKKDMAGMSDRIAKDIHEVVLSSTNGPGLSLTGDLRGPDSIPTKDVSTAMPQPMNAQQMKRDREVDLEDESDTSTPTNKRTRLDDADTSDHAQIVDGYLLIVWSQPMTEHQKIFLIEKMEGWIKLKSAADFIEPHTGEHTTYHTKKIKKPMDLSTMRSLLIGGGYSSVRDLVIDFRVMINNVLQTTSWTPERLMVAGRFWKCFCDRMKSCPTGPQGEEMATYSKSAIRIMASEILDISTKTSTPPSEISVAVDDSDRILLDGFIDHSYVLSEETQGHSFINDPASPFSIHNKPPHMSGSEATKTPEPDDQDEETRQLSREIEECQQKLAKMVVKKTLLERIRKLDTKMAEVNVEIPEMEEDSRHIVSEIQNLGHKGDAAQKEAEAALDLGDWHNEQREMLQKEAERLWNEGEQHRQEKEKLCTVSIKHLDKAQALLPERDQVQERGAQVLNDCVRLKTRRDQLDSERAIAKRELDELNDGGI